MPETCPLVVVVVLAWNGVADTLACLESLQGSQYARCRVILVDNGSHDATVAQVRAAYPGVQVIANRRNLGYAAGNNVGMQAALAQGAVYVFVLNNDTVVAPDCLPRLVADLEGEPAAAAVAPKALFLESPGTVYFAGGSIDHDGWCHHLGWGRPDGPQYSASGETTWLTGCAMLFRRQALETIGLFDRHYYLLYEDLDWSLRARRAGYSLRVVPAARIWHRVSPSFGGFRSPLYTYYATRNHLLWIERHARWREKPRFYRAALTASYRAVLHEARALPTRQKWAMRRAILAGLRDYGLRRFGRRA